MQASIRFTKANSLWGAVAAATWARRLSAHSIFAAHSTATARQLSTVEQVLDAGDFNDIAHGIWRDLVRPGDIVCDATCGNGYDTAFLAQVVGSRGTVHAIDIQESAIKSTRKRLEEIIPWDQMPEVHYHQGCHSAIQELVGSNRARLVCFNLGYLPGSDKAQITRSSSTLEAVEASFEALRPGGLLSILCYTGHKGGIEEYDAVKGLLATLPPRYWTCSHVQLLNRPKAPILILVWRRYVL